MKEEKWKYRLERYISGGNLKLNKKLKNYVYNNNNNNIFYLNYIILLILFSVEEKDRKIENERKERER